MMRIGKNNRMKREEFEKTVDDYSDVMLRCAYTYCGSRDDAEDIVQEAFLRYLRKAPDFRSEQHKRAWLLRVVINLSKDLTKSFWHRNKTSLDENTADGGSPAESLELWEAVRQLPPDLRVAVELYYREGLTIEEIAQATGSKISTVGDRLKRARKLLAESYKEG